MTFSFILVVLGLVLLWLGGEAIVRGSVIQANKLNISKLTIGLLIIGFGTSMPEMVVSVKAALDNAPQIALGNVLGSNIANVLLIIGVAITIAPIAGWKSDAKWISIVASVAVVVMIVLALDRSLGRGDGIIMLSCLMIYLIFMYISTRRNRDEPIEFIDSPDAIDAFITRHFWGAPVAIIAGIAGLVGGAEMLITGAVAIARTIGVSDTIIGLSLVAIGTSLPELAAAIVSSLRRQSEVILGSVLGSNIFNILAVLAVTTTLHSIDVQERVINNDMLVVIAISVGLMLALFVMHKMGRMIGILMLAVYAFYIATLYH